MFLALEFVQSMSNANDRFADWSCHSCDALRSFVAADAADSRDIGRTTLGRHGLDADNCRQCVGLMSGWSPDAVSNHAAACWKFYSSASGRGGCDTVRQLEETFGAAFAADGRNCEESTSSHGGYDTGVVCPWRLGTLSDRHWGGVIAINRGGGLPRR